jgi:hypothetical protein
MKHWLPIAVAFLRHPSSQPSERLPRQHHLRARSNSQSGIKGVKYNWGPRTLSADIYRNGQAKRVGTFWTRKEAMEAHQEALERENRDLHTAPEVIDRRVDAGHGQEGGGSGSAVA